MLDEKAAPETLALRNEAPYLMSSVFRMFSGKGRRITLRFDKSVLNSIYDRFGEKINVRPCGDGKYQISRVTSARSSNSAASPLRRGEYSILIKGKQLVQIGDNGFTGWSKDLYDPGYSKGIPKNLSEDERFDEMFPTHPLSQLRAFKKTLIEEN